jgi:hypothetical protein
MTSKQYEELCRFFLAKQLGVSTDEVVSVHIPNPGGSTRLSTITRSTCIGRRATRCPGT